MAKRLPSPEHADTLSINALRGLVTGLLERSQQAEGRLAKLQAETIQLREENAALGLENTQPSAVYASLCWLEVDFRHARHLN